MSTTDTKFTNNKDILLLPHQTHTLIPTTYVIQMYMKHTSTTRIMSTNLQLRLTIKQILRAYTQGAVF